MKLRILLSTIFISLFLSGQVFAEGSKFDRFATDAETTAQTRDDVGLTPSNIPSITATPGNIGETTASNATFQDTIWLKDANGTHIIKSVLEPGLDSRFTVGVDEVARTFVVCDAGDVDTDLGLSASTDPILYIYKNGGSAPVSLQYDELFFEASGEIYAKQGLDFLLHSTNLGSGNGFEFKPSGNIRLTDTNNEQSWLYIEPKINQTLTGGWNGLKIKATIISEGNATIGDCGGTNNLILAGTSTDPDMFKVDNVGRICVAESSDPAALADHVFFYGKDTAGTAEAFAADAAANAAQLTAHNDSLFDPDPNELYPWMPYYKNSALGVEAGFDMSRALRDLQAVTGTDYIHYRNISKTIDLEKAYKEQWIKNYIESNAQKIEVLKVQALETTQINRPKIYEVEVPYQLCDENGACVNKIKIIKQRKKIGETTTGYEFVDGEVKPKVEFVWETEIVDKIQLKKGIYFDESDGKFYSIIKPTLTEAVVAAEKGFCFSPPKWLNDRLTKVEPVQGEK